MDSAVQAGTNQILEISFDRASQEGINSTTKSLALENARKKPRSLPPIDS